MEGKKDAEGLNLLGSNTSGYQFADPSAKILEVFPNPKMEENYLIQHETEEFTSLCPKTGQPDFAKVLVTYVAGKDCVESKSLKLYLFSYRNSGAFMERICNTIADHLVEAMGPRWLAVSMEFKARGGITTTVAASRGFAGHRTYTPEIAYAMEEANKRNMKSFMEAMEANNGDDDLDERIRRSSRNEL
jgi:7-cyano-7-deazaguanine reductase